jgi:hypothetical protein
MLSTSARIADRERVAWKRIPHVLYVGFTSFRALYADVSVEILALVSRDLSQRPGARTVAIDTRRRSAATPVTEASR